MTKMSTSFQHHFKICLLWVLDEKNVAFLLISFAVLNWDERLWVQLPFDLPFQLLVQLLLELEANLLDQNVYELEFEPSRM